MHTAIDFYGRNEREHEQNFLVIDKNNSSKQITRKTELSPPQ